MGSTQSDAAASYFNSRATTYGSGQGSWHEKLASDFIAWAKIASGQHILDLACGTGLCTIPAAQAAGPIGRVIAVDISSSMLEVARQKQIPQASAPIEWLESDVSDLSHLDSVQMIANDAGFDLIICCSSFGYLPNRAMTVQHWLSLLKPGGRLICDVPTDEVTVQYVFGTSFRDITGIGVPFDREWVQSIHTLEELLKDQGYVIEQSWRTESYTPQRWLEKRELGELFETQLQQVTDSKIKDKWRILFKTLMSKHQGQLKEAYAVYVTIAARPIG